MSEPKKKRGRPRLSDKASSQNINLEKKKRGRRKKNETDSLHRVLGDFDSGENKLSFESEEPKILQIDLQIMYLFGGSEH